MKVLMTPNETRDDTAVSQVVRAYLKLLPKFGVEFVGKGDSYDVHAVHAGITGSDCTVAILHGMYWTADYHANGYEYRVNQNIVEAVRSARIVTVPSAWCAEVFQRDMRISPRVVPHGINADEWSHKFSNDGYVLWNKNRNSDVCDATMVGHVAHRLPKVSFISTFHPGIQLSNVEIIGTMAHEKMKPVVQKAGVYLSTVKETFCLGALEAMASGVPVAGFDYGGNSVLIEHGINGYLATPGDYDDLARGIAYCFDHRNMLSANAVTMAQKWTWDNAVQTLYKVFEDSLYVQPNSISVIIPVYNYADKVGRAIESCLNQTTRPDEIIVVDDGSTDNPRPVVESYNGKNGVMVTYINQNNQGVAIARNTGVSNSFGKFICCLDADDAIDPLFLQRCVGALQDDPLLSIAYTKIRAVDSNGNSSISQWPGEYNYDEQLKRHNQIPTCCVMRRIVWERLGGQRQRYAPQGMGAEDGEFWLRTGANGFHAKLVTEEPLFIYSMTGRTSKSGYKEVDWTTWHPWTKDGQHPLASLAKPARMSHPVRQYDEPLVSIVIPVGKGHERLVMDALDSCEAQTFRRWEVNVVWDSPTKPSKELMTAYPYIRLFNTKVAKSGAGAARNVGAEHARGSFLLFLDADDYLDPNAIEKYLIEWQYSNSIVYSDYYGICTTNEEGLKELGNKVVDYNPKTQQALVRHGSSDYNCARAQTQPDPNSLYHWCLVTCLIPKAWHKDIGGFDETMPSWEDVDYHWRMARAGKCYSRITEPLITYRFDTGNRREYANPLNNRQIAQNLLQYMIDKYERIPNMPCVTCNGGKSAEASTQIQQEYDRMINHLQPKGDEPITMNDSDYVLIVYMHPNRGEHKVIGPATGIDYGYRCGGEQFLVSLKDVKLSEYLFQRIDIRPIAVQERREEPVPVPAVLQKAVQPPPMPVIPQMNKEDFDMQLIAGLSPAMADQLAEIGVDDPEKLVNLGKMRLMALRGIGEKRADLILENAKKIADARAKDK
jgi:glycosyltransferase involved in cell wall biosynthesis